MTEQQQVAGTTAGNPVVLVTGAYGGLGAAVAGELAEQGATVIMLGRKVRQLERVYDAVIKRGTEPMLYPLDLEGASPDDYFELMQAIGSQLGRLDAIVHAAANFEGLTPLNQLDPAKLARALHVNFTSMAWLTQAAQPLLRDTAERTGVPSKVMVVVDDAERVSNPFWGGYGLAQLSRRQFVQMQARELGENSSIQVLGFMPGPMRTMLRSRAYADDPSPQTRNPADVAPVLVQSLNSGNHHGQIIGASL